MEKAIVPSLNDPANYVSEIIDKEKKGQNIIYQKRVIKAKPSEQ